MTDRDLRDTLGIGQAGVRRKMLSQLQLAAAASTPAASPAPAAAAAAAVKRRQPSRLGAAAPAVVVKQESEQGAAQAGATQAQARAQPQAKRPQRDDDGGDDSDDGPGKEMDGIEIYKLFHDDKLGRPRPYLGKVTYLGRHVGQFCFLVYYAEDDDNETTSLRELRDLLAKQDEIKAMLTTKTTTTQQEQERQQEKQGGGGQTAAAAQPKPRGKTAAAAGRGKAAAAASGRGAAKAAAGAAGTSAAAVAAVAAPEPEADDDDVSSESGDDSADDDFVGGDKENKAPAANRRTAATAAAAGASKPGRGKQAAITARGKRAAAAAVVEEEQQEAASDDDGDAAAAAAEEEAEADAPGFDAPWPEPPHTRLTFSTQLSSAGLKFILGSLDVRSLRGLAALVGMPQSVLMTKRTRKGVTSEVMISTAPSLVTAMHSALLSRDVHATKLYGNASWAPLKARKLLAEMYDAGSQYKAALEVRGTQYSTQYSALQYTRCKQYLAVRARPRCERGGLALCQRWCACKWSSSCGAEPDAHSSAACAGKLVLVCMHECGGGRTGEGALRYHTRVGDVTHN